MIFEGSPRCVRTSLKNDLKVRGESGIISVASKYPGIAKLVSRLVWERGAERWLSRTASPEPLANTAFLVSPFSRKIPFDHMFDHSCAKFKISYPGVVQLIERAVWDREAESLSLSTRTSFKKISDKQVAYRKFFVLL